MIWYHQVIKGKLNKTLAQGKDFLAKMPEAQAINAKNRQM